MPVKSDSMKDMDKLRINNRLIAIEDEDIDSMDMDMDMDMDIPDVGEFDESELKGAWESEAKCLDRISALPPVAGVRCNPQPLENTENIYDLEPEQILACRWTGCKSYDRCLDIAAIADWEGIDCRSCPVYWRRNG